MKYFTNNNKISREKEKKKFEKYPDGLYIPPA